jgi:hypothetical protein
LEALFLVLWVELLSYHDHFYYFLKNKGTSSEDRPLFVAIALNTTVNPSQTSYEEGLKIYDEWEKFVNQKVRLVVNIKNY